MLLFLDDRQEVIELSRLPERSPGLDAHRHIVEQRVFLRLMTVQLKAKHPESRLVQAFADNLKGGEFLRYKQDRFPLRQSCRYQVGDRLGLTGTGRSFDHEVLASQSMDQGAVLG